MSAYTYQVEMTCEGCSNAINRILNKQLGEGESFNIDLPGKKVVVTSSKRSKDEVLEILKKSGKSVTFIN